MDRRQRKTRNAIFTAFTQLLSEKSYDQITVGQIIARADVGRATFYAHFETKEYLLKALCQELFAHVFEAQTGDDKAHSYIFDCDDTDAAFLHLFRHLQKNDNHILDLLSCRSNELFLDYFKNELRKLAESQKAAFDRNRVAELPESFWIDHICATFVATVRWWIENGMEETPEQINHYFFLAV